MQNSSCGYLKLSKYMTYIYLDHLGVKLQLLKKGWDGLRSSAGAGAGAASSALSSSSSSAISAVTPVTLPSLSSKSSKENGLSSQQFRLGKRIEVGWFHLVSRVANGRCKEWTNSNWRMDSSSIENCIFLGI